MLYKQLVYRFSDLLSDEREHEGEHRDNWIVYLATDYALPPSIP